MLKIKYTKEEVSIEVDGELAEGTRKFILEALDKVKEFPLSQKIEGTPLKMLEGYTTACIATPLTSTPPESREVIRERLPNSLNGAEVVPNDNMVDLSKVKMEKPSITKHTHFRCPDCGQSVLTVVNDTIVMRDLENKEDNLCILTGVDLENFDYEEAKDHVSDIGACLVADGLTEARCPKCSSEKLIELWVNAYEQPLKYFECEKPCPICGSETVFSVDRSGTSVLKCDKDTCGYELKEVK